jgi:hypothetical protein
MCPLIHIFQNNRQEGPYTAEQVQAMLESGIVAPITLAWKEGMSEWAPLSTVMTPTPPATPVSAPPPPPLAHEAAPMIVQTPIPSGSVGPKGVGGWLVFFCVGLTILGPLFSLGQMVTAWEDSQAGFSSFPSIKTAVIWENFGSALLLIYSFVVGCIVWSGSPNGKSVAKKYLVIRLFGFIGVEFIAILLMGDLPSEVLAAGIGGVFGAGITEVFYFLIWWFYFKKSKRVRNTYG